MVAVGLLVAAVFLILVIIGYCYIYWMDARSQKRRQQEQDAAEDAESEAGNGTVVAVVDPEDPIRAEAVQSDRISSSLVQLRDSQALSFGLKRGVEVSSGEFAERRSKLPLATKISGQESV